MSPSSALTLEVTGMTCGGCEAAVRRSLLRLAGVESVDASHAGNRVTVVFDSSSVTPDAIRGAIGDIGYRVSPGSGQG